MTTPAPGTTEQRKAPPATLPPLMRFFSAPDMASALDTEARTLKLSFSSDFPVERWYGTEILSHAPGAVDLSRLNGGAPLLFNHNMDDLRGIAVAGSAVVDSVASKGYATVRFANTPAGDEAMQLVKDEVLCNVSCMYRVLAYTDMGDGQFLATSWMPLEISLVTVPADPTVGVGRAAESNELPVRITRAAADPVPSTAAPAARSATTGVTAMSDENNQQAGAGSTAASTTIASVVDITQARASAAGEERARIAEIEAMASAHKLPDELRRDMIQRGVSVAEARGIVLTELGKRGEQQSLTANGHAPDLTAKEKGNYSMIRAINASITGNWKEAGFEAEVSNDIAKRMGKGTTGFFMPTNLPFAKRSYNTGTATAGGDLVATNLLAGSFIEVLRNKSRVMQLGATILSGLVGNVDIPRRTSATNTYWVGESVDLTEAEGTFDKVSLSMKTVGALSVITRNMLMQGTPDIEMLARADMIAQVALAIDLAALSGSGSNYQPTGIANLSGVGSVVGGTNGGALTIDNLIDLETQCTQNNAPEDSLAYLANARSVGALKKLKSTTGEYLWVTNADVGRTGTPGEINGYPVARSNQARSNLTKGTGTGLSELFFGAWSELLIGEWGVLEVQPNPYAAAVAKQGGVQLRVLQSIDIAARHAQSFAVMSDAITS